MRPNALGFLRCRYQPFNTVEQPKTVRAWRSAEAFLSRAGYGRIKAPCGTFENQAQAVLADFEEADNLGREHLQTLQQFFPEITWSDLNTQDY
jgi:hypothetical protein